MAGLLYFTLPFAAGLLAVPFTKRAPVHGALLATWAAATLLLFAPGGLLLVSVEAGYSLGGVLIGLVSISGFMATAGMMVRLSRLHRGQALGRARFLVAHHVAVPLAFLVHDLQRGSEVYPTLFTIVACFVGVLIVAYDPAKKTKCFAVLPAGQD